MDPSKTFFTDEEGAYFLDARGSPACSDRASDDSLDFEAAMQAVNSPIFFWKLTIFDVYLCVVNSYERYSSDFLLPLTPVFLGVDRKGFVRYQVAACLNRAI